MVEVVTPSPWIEAGFAVITKAATVGVVVPPEPELDVGF